jgi:nicotinamide-nucleotide amidase
MLAELITIGNELLNGQTTDTNSAWLARQFQVLGIRVNRITSVSDSGQEILEILRESGSRADIIIITGGLGPTSDDVTKPALCEYFETDLVFRPEIYDHIVRLLARKNININEYNKKQAEVPGSAIILHNEEGTAAGLWFSKNGKIYISLPGVPFEMKGLFMSKVVPALKEIYDLPPLYYKTVITQGSFEAQLAEELKDFEASLPDTISLAYLPSPGIIRLRLGINGGGPRHEEELERQIVKLQKIIPEYIIGYNDDSLEKIIGMLLSRQGRTLSVAESCTGGAIASLITSVPGSSVYFKGGIVAYANEIKRDQLAIDGSLIEEYGAVSKQVVEDMAIHTRLLFNTHYSVAASGIAGPSGGSDEKPVGTIWIAVSCQGSVMASEFRFGDNRERNIRRASVAALNMLRKMIIRHEQSE